MTDSLYEYVLDELERAKGRLPEVARESDVALTTIRKIVARDVANPGVLHIEKLARYFRDYHASA